MSRLDKLRDDKAAGADELIPRFLNKIKLELARSLTLTMFFRKVTDNEQVPGDWKEANVIPIYVRVEIGILQLTIDRLVSQLKYVKFLRL